MNLKFALGTGLGCLLLFAASVAHGQMYVWLVIDPATTAGAGIPAAGSLSVASNKSGSGSFHLYAVDDVAGSFGISSYSVNLTGTLTSLIHRSPSATWHDADDIYHSEGFGSLRSSVNINPVSAAQGDALPDITGKPLISGFGQTSSNFIAKQTSDFNAFFGPPISGQWGNYADPNTQGTVVSTGHARNALFLAEGTYTGASPNIDLGAGTAFTYWTSDPESNPGALRVTAPSVLASNPFTVPEPGTMPLLGMAIMLCAQISSRPNRCRTSKQTWTG